MDSDKKKYNKAYVVGEYVRGLGEGIAKMLQKGDHATYQWNAGDRHNPHRKEMIDAVHEKFLDALSQLEDK